MIRNNSSFHYYHSSTKLKKAFQDFFFKQESSDSNKFAYYSIGESMNTTRFYYADAATMNFMKITSEEGPQNATFTSTGKFKDEMKKTIENMNFTILRLLKAYLKNRPK